MNKNNKLPHLNIVWKDKDKSEIKSHVLYVNVPPGERAQAVSNALDMALGDSTYNKSSFVCDCVISGVQEPEAQRRIDLALKVCDEMTNPNYALADVSRQQVKIIRMALLGCPTTTATEFTGELSQEYIERYGNE